MSMSKDVPRVLLAAAVLSGCYEGAGREAGETGSSTAADDDPSDPSTPTGNDEGNDEGVDSGVDEDSTDPSTSDSSAGSDASATDPTDPSADGTSSDGGTELSATCMRWIADRADLDEGTWSGSVNGCNPGDISVSARENALRVTNLYRWMADLPAITTDPGRDAQAQACALMMTANGTLSHTPPESWTCYSSAGADAAGNSNIASTASVFAVDLYMVDPGNETTLGHRRWLLSNSIGPTGIGSTDEYSCMWALGGSGDAGAVWTAWPPPGEFPLAAAQLPWTSMDETGWSVQSDTIDLSGADVAITVAGDPRPVSVTALDGGYGSQWAISMIPQGWTMTAGTTYHVRIDGLSQLIEYDVVVEDCGP